MNTNSLAGVICPNPKCFQRDRFCIEATSWFTVMDDGTDEFGDVEYGDRSHCRCANCGHTGTLAAFKNPRSFERAAKQALAENDWPQADDLLQEAIEFCRRVPRRVTEAYQALQVAAPDLAAIATRPRA
jgi:hypothetical protein